MLYDMNNPITNIRLSLELFGTAPGELRQVYLNIIEKSALALESSVREICGSFTENNLTVNFKAGAAKNVSDVEGQFLKEEMIH